MRREEVECLSTMSSCLRHWRCSPRSSTSIAKITTLEEPALNGKKPPASCSCYFQMAFRAPEGSKLRSRFAREHATTQAITGGGPEPKLRHGLQLSAGPNGR